MRDSDIVTPLCVAQDPLLGCPCLLAQNSLRCIGEHTEYDLVKHLLGLWHVVIRIHRIVQILLLSALSQEDSYIG